MNKHKPWERLGWVVVLVVLGGGASLAILRAEALERLRERLKTQADDLLARKELAVRLAEHGRMVEADELSGTRH